MGRYRLLVVDDCEDLRLLLANCISSFGHRVVAQAVDGEQAVALYREHRPDAVLLDIQMPGRDGWYALHEILALDPKAIVIMLTAESGPAVRERCEAEGACGYLRKPFVVDRLHDEIRAVLELAGLRSRGIEMSQEYYEYWIKPRVSFPDRVKAGEDEEPEES